MYKNAIVIDGLQYCNPTREYFKLLQLNNITAVHVALSYHENARETLTNIAKWNRIFEENSDIIKHLTSMESIKDLKEKNKVGIFFGAQNCSLIEEEIGLVEIMRKLGVFVMQLTYNNQSLLASGHNETNDNGVTRFGQEVIAEMNRIGMIIDMSHSGEKSILQAIEISSRPICLSHINPFVDQSSDQMTIRPNVIKTLVDNKGIIGISLYPILNFNKENHTLAKFCERIANLADKYGVDAIGIGSNLSLGYPNEVFEWLHYGKWSKNIDYGLNLEQKQWQDPPNWFNNPSGMKSLYDKLLSLGFSENDLNQIIGNNWLNFLSDGIKPYHTKS